MCNLVYGSGYGVCGIWVLINEKGQVLYFGLSYVDYDIDVDILCVCVCLNVDLVIVCLVDSGNLVDIDCVSMLGVEVMYIGGLFKVQVEYYISKVKCYSYDNYSSDGFYVSGLWNIIGESWGYKGGILIIGLLDELGCGMWQLGVCYDQMDFNDGNFIVNLVVGCLLIVDGVFGGKMNIWIVGVNYYWCFNIKFVLNYVMVDSKKYSLLVCGFVNDDLNIFEVCLQFFW